MVKSDEVLAPETFYASLVDSSRLEREFSAIADPEAFTRFEKLAILSVTRALQSNPRFRADDNKCLFLLSTTKGNVDLLESQNKNKFEPERKYLWRTAEIISEFFGNRNKPMVISNACISGVLAIINASDMIRSGLYHHVVVIGADIASEFVVSGFQSFKSLSNGPCKPFDISRDGLNLGEGSGTILLSGDTAISRSDFEIKVLGGASSNDSNHISGPSRTGEGLFFAVEKAIRNSDINSKDLDFISAHGTATPFNDEMEAKAFNLAGLSAVPLNSFKGYIGHTLGAAGIIESVFSICGMRENLIYKTLGFHENGVPDPVNVNDRLLNTEINFILKTASGFGGCNAAIVYAK